MKNILILALSLFTFAFVGIKAAPAQSAWMGSGAGVLGPPGYMQFCRHAGSGNTVCAAAGDGQDFARITPKMVGMLETFNRRTNAHIRYRDDRDLLGKADHWAVAGREGDCEDIALAKRQRLIEAGCPAGALWLAMGELPGIGAHVVLVIRTSSGDFVLDSLTDSVHLWHTSPMQWLVRLQPRNPRLWQIIATDS